MELGVGTLFSTSAGSVSGAGVGDVLVDSRDGALREGSKPWAADKRTIAAAWSDPRQGRGNETAKSSGVIWGERSLHNHSHHDALSDPSRARRPPR